MEVVADHGSARSRGNDYILGIPKDIQEVDGDFASLRAVPAVISGLSTAGLGFGKIDVVIKVF